MNPFVIGILFNGVLFIGAVGFFCVGYLWGSRRELRWRIHWIELEHDCARAQGRKPRNITDFENAGNPPKPTQSSPTTSTAVLDVTSPPKPPPCRLILESEGCGTCSACGSSLRRKYYLFGKKRCIQPLCKSNVSR